jgi:transposase-like protein
MPRYNNPRRTWQYTNEFKVKAVQLSLIEGIQVKSVAEILDIHPFMLSRWRKEYREGKIVVDTRKKITAVSCGGTSARYRFIEKLNEQLSVKSLCLWLGVSSSGYYAWRKRQLSNRSIENAELKTVIKKIFDENKGRYGSPRVFKALIKQGYAIGKKRVARLMKELKLVGRVVRVTHRSPGLKRFLASGENLRPQGGVPKEKNKIWVADVTYLKVSGRCDTKKAA